MQQSTVSRGDLLVGLADSLHNAQETRAPIKPLTDTVPDLSLAEAYRIQRHNIDRAVKNGQRVIGHKIGLTAIAMQQLFGVDEPDYGHLTDAMMLDPGQPLALDRLIDPQIEVEPAFVLKKDLKGPGLTVDHVLDATDYISICFEIIDSRIEDWRIKLEDTVSDNGSSAFVLMGETRFGPRDFDLRELRTELHVDGVLVEEGNTSAILGHPANGIAWLANKISEFGNHLHAGDIVLPGTCTRSYRIAGKGSATGSIARLGEVALNFTGRPTVVKEA
ncbi:2-keto-4-pentenoate hydratase [Croceicoccus sediminis]|uniref:2-keto-4-pentenoate hydratase n=1 Tax=Croceicoccus sediminis TaxID=2571150 RepID=UPI0011845BD5|nr:fumarylacetoacetate hydrolase family protein [Croceicoccus sediminis]